MEYKAVLWGSTPDISGERLTGSQEVKGSIPFISTTIFDERSRLLLQLTSFVLHVIL